MSSQTTEVATTNDLAIVDPITGELLALPSGTPSPLPLEEAERVFGVAQQYASRLRRIIDFAKIAIEFGWTSRGQKEGILGGERYVLEAKPGAYQYSESLHDALVPFVGRVFTENELREATGRTVMPARVEVVPEQVLFAYSTAKLDALARKASEVRAVIEEHRHREPGVPSLTRSRK